MEFNFLQNLSTADPKSWHFFAIVMLIAVLVAGFLIAKIQEQDADSRVLENSGSFVVRRGLIMSEREGGVGATVKWPAYANLGAFALKWPKYSLRYAPDFRISENDSFSTFESREGHCVLKVGTLGEDIDFVVVKKREQEVKPFTLAILQLSKQWAGLKDFEYYLFSDEQNGISVEGEAANSTCLDTLLKIISTFKFTN